MRRKLIIVLIGSLCFIWAEYVRADGQDVTKPDQPVNLGYEWVCDSTVENYQPYWRLDIYCTDNSVDETSFVLYYQRDGEPQYKGVEVQSGDISGKNAQIIFSIPDSFATPTCFRVTAKNDCGESVYSDVEFLPPP